MPPPTPRTTRATGVRGLGLVGRGTETAEERERRLDTARLEMAAEPEFDVTIVNDDVHRATDELVQCMGLVPRPLGVARG